MSAWRGLLAGKYTDDFELFGDYMNATYDEDDFHTRQDHPSVRGRFPGAPIEQMTTVGLRHFRGIHPGMAERCDATLRVRSYRVARSAAAMHPEQVAPATQNDTEDEKLLMQLGLPSFVATTDGRLIDDVCASGTYQAAWVRRVSELLTGQLPSGVPWGQNAKRETKHYLTSRG